MSQALRPSLHACFTRRADALFELGGALLCAPAITSVAQLSLEPSHRRGWGSAYAALARGRVQVERLRDLLVSSLPDTDPLVFAVDATTWPRCDAECSPSRGYYYHPSRHSAGQPIIAGWAWQWICQLSFDRDSWTAPVDAQRLHPVDDTDHTAAAQIRALLGRLSTGGRCRGLCSTPATTPPSSPSTWPRRRWRCWCGCAPTAACYADPPPRQRARPAAHAATAPSSTAPTRRAGRPRPPPLAATTTGMAPSPSPRGQGCIPSSSATPATAAAGVPPDRARHHHPRPGPAGPGPHAPAQGAVVVVGRLLGTAEGVEGLDRFE
jgi:hypothetical protein